ncbi:MAG TPA: fluoride efflux transporter CrcB [Exiguobacterium sp.]|uniref:fluoride efflux transporter CrcB n=1 Tax=Exiguobacterium sp. TaxID=44751 RepID=UPI000EC31448|nr:fluoride efflux transporter CrcB [Exiguobacterium sp.]HCN58328.1 fluoride efflux transporter CrcB [Exiguobacterium sp.]
MNLLALATGAFLGAISRFAISQWMKTFWKKDFPLATFGINILGSFLLGLVIGSHLDSTWTLLLGTGFLGSFTTFSTFKLETLQLVQNQNRKTLVLYLGLSYLLGISAAFLGIIVSSNS